jgi:hybrid cluster-associated redox disulfide protein
MRVGDILALCPEAREALAEYGLHCAGCAYNAYETLEEGCGSHGFDSDEINALVTDLNELLASRPPRPQTLTMTSSAAGALRGVAKDEGKQGHGLAVIFDEHGGFCMEFRAKAEEDEQTFQSDGPDPLSFFASPATLSRIGGSTIDFRDGRFKLDLPGDASPCACGGECSCA